MISLMWIAGAWPAITQEESQDAVTKSRNALRNAFDAWEGVTALYFNVSYTVNGTDTAALPGIFVTPDASQKLPLVIVGTGLDWPKEVSSALICAGLQDALQCRPKEAGFPTLSLVNCCIK